jgi:hypothetical protein
MARATKIGFLCGLVIYGLRLLLAFIVLVLAQPRFGGISGFPLSAIWMIAVLLLPWLVVSTVVATVAVLLAARSRVT